MKLLYVGLHLLLWLSFVTCFWFGLTGLWQTYTSFWLLENAIAAGVITAGFMIVALKQFVSVEELIGDHTMDRATALNVLAILAIACSGLLLNNFLGGFSIGPQILTYVAVYAVLGLYLKPTFWRRSLFVCLALILTLPILERVQKYAGFPLRLITAKIVSLMLQVVGAGHVSNSTIIVTENHATSIDLPCSGVKSLYFGGVIMLAVYFLHQVKVSFKAIGVATLFLILLILFNIWRVFALVYVYALLQFREAGDTIHVGLGIFGFAVSCAALWWLTEKYLVIPSSSHHVKPEKKTKKSAMNAHRVSYLQIVSAGIVMLLATTVVTRTVLALPPQRIGAAVSPAPSFQVPDSSLTVLPFTETEETLFLDAEVSLATKYEMRWRSLEVPVSLLLVKSSSARTHHDPELCLQGLGYQLLSQEQVTLGEEALQHLTLQTAENPSASRATVYYWYVSQDEIITDYSQRVWAEFNRPDQEWVLVEVAVADKVLSQTELELLFTDLTQAVREHVL